LLVGLYDCLFCEAVDKLLINKGDNMSRNKCWICKKDLNWNAPIEHRIINYLKKCKEDKYLRQYCSCKCRDVDFKVNSMGQYV
jgi:endogenous inhibitor of DNA gyrase (YacG/DUF329 family)